MPNPPTYHGIPVPGWNDDSGRMEVTAEAGAATATAIAAGTIDVDAVVAAATGLRLIGFAAVESAATPAAAEFRIIHGATAAGGTLMFPVTLGADESTSDWFGPGIAVANGLSIDRVSGTTEVVLYTKVVL